MSQPASARAATADRVEAAADEDQHQPFIPADREIPELTPAPLILGYNLEIGQVILVSVLGGLLGILMMIPLRRALIVKEAKTLVYPEGTACAEVLISGETGGTTAKTVFAGLGVGGVFALGYKAFGVFKDVPQKLFGKG